MGHRKKSRFLKDHERHPISLLLMLLLLLLVASPLTWLLFLLLPLLLHHSSVWGAPIRRRRDAPALPHRPKTLPLCQQNQLDRKLPGKDQVQTGPPDEHQLRTVSIEKA